MFIFFNFESLVSPRFPDKIEYLYNRGLGHWDVIRCFFTCAQYKHGFVFSIDHAYKKEDDGTRLERTKFGKFIDARTKGKEYSGPEDLVALALSSSDLYIQLKEKHGYSSFPHAHWIDTTSGTLPKASSGRPPPSHSTNIHLPNN